MIHKGTETLTTNRLVLRKLELDDALSLYEIGSLGKSLDDAENIVRLMMEYNNDPLNYNWVIVYKDKAIGRIKVNEFSERDRYMQIAYDIGYSYRNKGLMTEAVKKVITFLLNDVGVHRVYGQCRKNNLASIKVLQKSGMTYEGCLRKHFLENNDIYVDVEIYGIIQEDLCSNPVE